MTQVSARRSGLFANLKTSVKIYAGFGVVLTLLTSVAGVAWHGLTDSVDGLHRFEKQAEVAALASSLETSMLEARLAGRAFLDDHSDAAAKQFDAAVSHTREQARVVRAAVTLPENARLVDELVSLVDNYEQGFSKTKQSPSPSPAWRYCWRC